MDWSILNRLRVNVEDLSLREVENGEEAVAAQKPYLFWLVLIFMLIVAIELALVYIFARFCGKFEIDAAESQKTMVVLGSGGHTAEMLKLISSLDKKRYRPRCYVAAATDKMSGARAATMERVFEEDGLVAKPVATQASTSAGLLEVEQEPEYEILTIPRSREVGQSYITSIYTTLKSAASAAAVVLNQQPKLILVNGPGTCIPVCFTAALFRAFGLSPCKIVYVESIARTRKLSLSGLILYKTGIADMILVQWEELLAKYPKCKYAGRLY